MILINEVKGKEPTGLIEGKHRRDITGNWEMTKPDDPANQLNPAKRDQVKGNGQ